MSASVEVTFDSRAIQKELDRLETAVQRGEFQPVMHQWAVLVAEQLQANFKEHGRRAQPGGWKPLSWITMALRQQGEGQKARTFADLKAWGRQAQPLEDTGRLKSSVIDLGRATIGRDFVRFGPSVDYGGLHQQGSTRTFVFGPEQERRLAKNVAQTLSGPSRPNKSGRQTRARANWNPDFFIMRAAFRKMNGQALRVVPRKIVYPMPEPVRRDMMLALARKVRELMGR